MTYHFVGFLWLKTVKMAQIIAILVNRRYITAIFSYGTTTATLPCRPHKEQ